MSGTRGKRATREAVRVRVTVGLCNCPHGGARDVGMMAERLGLPGLQTHTEEEPQRALTESPISLVDPPLPSPLDYPSRKGITDDGQRDESSQPDSPGVTRSDHTQDGSTHLPQGDFAEDRRCNSPESRGDSEAHGRASEELTVSSNHINEGEEERGASSPQPGLKKPTSPSTMDGDSGLGGIEAPGGLHFNTSIIAGHVNGEHGTSEEDLPPESSEITLELRETTAPVDGDLSPPSLVPPGESEPVGVNHIQDLGSGELGVDFEDDLKDLTDSASTDNTLEDSGDFPGISTAVGEGGTSEASPPSSPTLREEDVTAESWRTKRRHVFVLSEAGKPIYSRYGNEEALSSTMGVMMALVSFVQSGNNSIRSIHSDNQKVVFLQQGPLVLVSVSRAPQSEEQLRQELQYVYNQIISMLTQASVARIFETKKNYDLRRLLAGSEKILDSLLDLMDTDPGFLLGAVRCVALPSTLRDSLSSILTKAITPNLVFSILVAKHQLVTVVQERAVIEDCRLDPADLLLLLNLIGASSAFQAGEIWTPICLPCFNPDGYFYAYISYLDPECTVCLVLLSTDKESFYAVSGCKRKIQEAMEAQNSLQALGSALRYCSYSVSLVGIPELLHFVYRPLDIPEPYRQLPQFTSPEPDGPYSSEEEKQRLFDLYRYLHCRIHSSARPLRLIYHVAEKETLLAWVTSKFELYTAFSSLVTKVGAINVITKLLRWIKREEDRLFIRYPPKYSTTPLPGKGGKAGRTDRTDPSQNGFFTGI